MLGRPLKAAKGVGASIESGKGCWGVHRKDFGRAFCGNTCVGQTTVCRGHPHTCPAPLLGWPLVLPRRMPGVHPQAFLPTT
eukprot:355554-Chlamydomonas_euryale.AAC.2